jgi:hypothetical protein
MVSRLIVNVFLYLKLFKPLIGEAIRGALRPLREEAKTWLFQCDSFGLALGDPRRLGPWG